MKPHPYGRSNPGIVLALILAASLGACAPIIKARRGLKYSADLISPSGVASVTHARVASSLTTGPVIYWGAATDTGGSGLDHYEFSIGTTSGASDIQGWTSAGTALTTTSGGLSLSDGSRYFVGVRAVDGAGNISTPVNSLGWTVIQSLSVGPLYPAAPQWGDYAKTSDPTQVCAGTEMPDYSACVHGGEHRKVDVPALASCTGLTLRDVLGAFNWNCDASSGHVIFSSGGLQHDASLSNLLTAAAWRPDSVILNDGTWDATQSPLVAWWTNPVVPLPDNSSAGAAVLVLSAASTIYTLASTRETQGYNLNADKIAVSVFPGATLRYVGSGTNNCTAATGKTGANDKICVIAAGSQKFLWLEGNLDAVSGGSVGSTLGFYGFYGSAVTYSKFRRIGAQGFSSYLSTGIQLGSSPRNFLSQIRVVNSCSGVAFFYGSNEEIASEIQVSQLRGCQGITTYNATDLTLTQAVISGSGNAMGIGYDRPTVSHVTAANIDVGLSRTRSTVGGTFSEMLFMNLNSGINLYIAGTGVTNDHYHDIALANSAQGAVFNGVTGNRFSGNLWLGGNAQDCQILAGANPGLADTTCANQAASTSQRLAGLDFSSSFVGKVVQTDSVNASNAMGLMAFATISDWLGFANPFRAWGIDGGVTAYPDPSYRSSSCTGGNCRIWDWRLRATDSVLRNRSLAGNFDNDAFVDGATCPVAVDGNQVLTDQRGRTYLAHAIEILEDGVGNDNGLCESGERCIYAPNPGAYQGEGDFVPHTCVFHDGSVSGVTMYDYPINGAP